MSVQNHKCCSYCLNRWVSSLLMKTVSVSDGSRMDVDMSHCDAWHTIHVIYFVWFFRDDAIRCAVYHSISTYQYVKKYFYSFLLISLLLMYGMGFMNMSPLHFPWLSSGHIWKLICSTSYIPTLSDYMVPTQWCFCYYGHWSFPLLTIFTRNSRWISQKRCKLVSPNLHRRLPGRL